MTAENMEGSLTELGIDPTRAIKRVRSESRQPRKRTRSTSAGGMELEAAEDDGLSDKKRRMAAMTPKPGEGYRDEFVSVSFVLPRKC